MLAELSELGRPLLRAAAGAVAHGRPTPPQAWRRGLILGHTHIGDVLYRTCSLEPLRALLPDCRWSYLCAPGTAELLEGNPAIAETLPLMTDVDSWQLAPDGFATLRARGFDVALCTNAQRHYPDLLLTAALGIPNRVGFDGRGLSGLLTHLVPMPERRRYPEYFRAMVAQVGGVEADWPLRPRVYPGAADRDAAATAWCELGLGLDRPVVACSLTVRQPHNDQARSHLIDALRLARRTADFSVVLIGAAADEAVLRAAASQLGEHTHLLAGRLGLRAVTAFLSRCAALVSLDSGPRHLGNAAGIPVLFVRGLLDSEVQTGAYCDTERDLAPAGSHLSPREAAEVIAAMRPEDASSALLDLLGRR